MFVGLVLLLVGIVALLVQMGVLSGSIWSYIWPLILIILGLWIIFRRNRHDWWYGHGHHRHDDEEKQDRPQ